MRAPQIVSFVLITAAAMVGCGGGGEGDDGDDDGTDTDGGGGDGTIPADYTRLIGREWTAPPPAPNDPVTDVYKCARVTIPNDIYITSFMSQSPAGSHHAVLSIADSRVAGPDGAYDCGVSTLGRVMLYASGVGTSPLDFPTDVGIRVAAGTQLHLNLHLFNASDSPISGDSAVLVKMSANPPPILAEMVFAGGFGFEIPASTPPPGYTFSAGCTANRNFSLFAVWPHQHKLGTHHKFEIIRGGTPNVLHDAAFNFMEQKYYLQTPIVEVQQGDQIRVTCTWINTTGQIQRFGDSSDQEMCFSGMYRYPAVSGTNLFQCTDTGGLGF